MWYNHEISLATDGPVAPSTWTIHLHVIQHPYLLAAFAWCIRRNQHCLLCSFSIRTHIAFRTPGALEHIKPLPFRWRLWRCCVGRLRLCRPRVFFCRCRRYCFCLLPWHFDNLLIGSQCLKRVTCHTFWLLLWWSSLCHCVSLWCRHCTLSHNDVMLIWTIKPIVTSNGQHATVSQPLCRN